MKKFNYFYGWLNCDVIIAHIDEIMNLRDSVRDVNENIVDPFSVVMEAAVGELTVETYNSQERQRQLQKTISNKIGHLHQAVLGAVPDWNSTGAIGGGLDIISSKRKVIAEVKNKYNTVKGSNLYPEVYQKLASCLERKEFKGFKAYYVTIIPKAGRGRAEPFTPSISRSRGHAPSRSDILSVGGREFYKLVTGRDNALRELLEATQNHLIKKYGIREECISLSNEYFRKAFGR